MAIKNTLIVLIIFTCLQSFSQNYNETIDVFKKRTAKGGDNTLKELNIRLNSAKTNEERLLIHSLISVTSIFAKKYEEVKKNLILGEQYLSDDKDNIEYAVYLYALARYCSIIEKPDLSIQYFVKALPIFKKNKRWDFASEVAVNIAFSKPIQEEKYYLEALDISKKSKDTSYIMYAQNAYATHINEEYQRNKEKYTLIQVLSNYDNLMTYIKDDTRIDNKFNLASAYINYGFALFKFSPRNEKIHYYLDKGYEVAKKI